MKRLVLMLVVSLVLMSSNAFAVRVGVFFDVSSGSGEAEWDSDWDAWDIDQEMVAGGFVLDTAAVSNRIFNYRLNIGIANQVLEDDFGFEFDSTGLYAENIFGFALNRKEGFRWWMGPLVRIGYYSGETDDPLIDIDYAEFAVGAVMGLNIQIDRLILSPSAGFRVTGFAGEGTGPGWKEDIEGGTATAFANVAILF